MSILFAAMVFSPLVTSVPTGMNTGGKGCSCHTATASPSVVPLIEGLPDVYNYSQTYELTVSFTGGPSTIGKINLGGFDLWASDGVLAPVDATVQSWGENEVTHTEVGNDQTSWTVMWTAPATDRNVEIILHTNSVNGNAGDGLGYTGDEWNKLVAKVNAPILVLEQANPYVVLSTLIVISAILLIITVTYIFYRTNPDSFNWESFEPWIVEWLTSTDHKKIGTLYFLAGMFFLGIGGIMALMIRIQLSVPGNDFLTQEQYNQFFTLHGTTMIFLAAMPLINGFANWMVPLQIGAPDLALPRINAMSF